MRANPADPDRGSRKPDQDACKVQEREEVLRKFLEAHRYPTEPLDPLEKALDEVPLLVEVGIEFVVRRARRVRRDHDLSAVRLELGA